MSNLALRMLALAAATALVSGCTAGNQTSYSTQNLTGNWAFTTLYPGPPPENIVYSGALSGEGANVTAILRTNRCFSPTQDIEFSGSEDAKQNLALTSTNLATNVVTITAALAQGNSPSAATVLVTGAGACSAPALSLSDFQIPSVTGNYTGSLTSALGTPASFTANPAQGERKRRRPVSPDRHAHRDQRNLHQQLSHFHRLLWITVHRQSRLQFRAAIDCHLHCRSWAEQQRSIP
jgi:hypothetical protein